jgi:hypothetical protein
MKFLVDTNVVSEWVILQALPISPLLQKHVGMG